MVVRFRMFCIKAENFELQIEVVRVDSLCQHERTLPHHVDSLIMEFKNWLIVKNRTTTVVLAHMDSFFLVFWMDTKSSPELSIDKPKY